MIEIQTWWRRKLPNWWVILPNRDPRFDGLSRIAAAIDDADDLAWGSIVYDRDNPDPGCPPIYSPRELAALLREAADRIEAWTAPDDV